MVTKGNVCLTLKGIWPQLPYTSTLGTTLECETVSSVQFSSPNVVTEGYTSYVTSVVTQSQPYSALESSFVSIIVLVVDVAWFIGYEVGKRSA